MTLLGTFREEHIIGTAWRENGTQDGQRYVTYWLQLQNGRGETWMIHTHQTPEVLGVLGKALKCIQDSSRVPGFKIQPETRGALSSRK